MFKIIKKLVIFIICFLFITCVHSPQNYSSAYFSGSIRNDYTIMTKEGVIMQANIVPLKDFSTLGIIFVESTAKINEDGLILEGTKITYDMLMKEAYKLGADDVINIKIDEIETVSFVGVIERIWDSEKNGYVYRDINNKDIQNFTRIINYKANALAIKYTNAIIIPSINK